MPQNSAAVVPSSGLNNNTSPIDLNFVDIVKIPIEENTSLPEGYAIFLTMT
jgi:hypothetical protein